MSNPLNRPLLGLRPSMLMFLYRRRLRAHLVQELLAGAGIAIGVALVFGVLLANTGLTNSTERLIRGLSGSARLTLVARSAGGFPESLASKVRTLPGVQVSTSVLRENVTVEGPVGSQALQLIGVSPSLATLGGISQQELGNGALLLSGGLGLPSGVAATIGAQRGERVTVVANGVRHRLNVGAIITSESVKALAGSPVVIALLSVAQKLTGRPERVTQTLVVPTPGHEAQVASELRAVARGRLDVEPVDHELSLLNQATVPNRQSTSLFSAISVMVGFLLALNAMLLTVPERRRFIAELRMQGYDPWQIVLLLAFQAVILGLIASVIGVVLGVVLAHNLYRQVPSYLVVAFPITADQSLGLAMALLAVASGVLATLLASLSPLLDLRPGLPADAAFREAGPASGVLTSTVTRRCGLSGLALIALVGGLVVAFPSLTILGGVALALATVLLVPPMLAMLAHWSPLLIAGSRSGAAIVAASELRAISIRSVALGAIVALAVYGSVAIGGARDDLLHGIEVAVAQYENTADIWVKQGRNVFNTDDFVVGDMARRVARAPGVLSVRVYRGGLSDIGNRRMWVRARVNSDPTVLESSQLLYGDFAQAQRLVRSGGWAAVSIDFADERHLHLGSMFDFPTPSGPAPLRVAAITTNGGWPAGTITLGGAEYARWWGGGEAAALEVSLRKGVSPQMGVRAVREALGPAALVVKTSAQSAAEADTSARQGLSTLSEISTMLLIVAALSVAAALSTTLWQRRARLASLKIQGYHQAQLWLGLLLESAAMLALGSLVGAAVGIYGHALAGDWLTISTGFPAPFALGISHILLTLALITIIASAVVSLAGLAVARVPPWVSLQE